MSATQDQPARVVAVSDSDSYLKWACATLDRLAQARGPHGTTTADAPEAVLVRSPILPTSAQVAAAVAGTSVAAPRVLGLVGLATYLRNTSPDVVLVAATGPVAELVARAALTVTPRPVLVSGLPGMALPATPDGVGFRRWADVFVVHSRVERHAYAAAFAAQDRDPQIPLARLPFLASAPAARPGNDDAPEEHPPVGRVVFAPQAKVPVSREDRVRLLAGLAVTASAGYDVVVKLRARAGERQTHDEAFPFDTLWDECHAGLGHTADLLRFEDGPMSGWLAPGTALVTVSSTAALESLALGLPTAILDDFGVDETMLNLPFADSGCVTSLAELPAVLADGGPRPVPGWLAENYLHDEADELPDVVRRLTARRREGTLDPDATRTREFRAWSPRRHTRAALRSGVPEPLLGWLVAAHRTLRTARGAVRDRAS